MPAPFSHHLEGIGRTAVGDPTSAGSFWIFGGLWTDTPDILRVFRWSCCYVRASTSLTIDSDTSYDSGPVIPSAPHKGKGRRPAKSSTKPRSAPPPPKKKLRLGRPSVDLKARKQPLRRPAALHIAFLHRSRRLGFDFVGTGLQHSGLGGQWPSSTASTASLPSTPVGPSGVTPGTEASVPVEIDDDGGSGADGATSAASVAPGGVFSSPVVSQPRRDGRPTCAASTTAGLRSMPAAENEAAPDTLVLGLAALSNTPAAAQASVARSTPTPDPSESAAVVAAASAAVVTSASSRRRVANTHTGPNPPARAEATPTPRQASPSRARTVVTATLSTMPGTRSTAIEPHSDLGFALWERAHWISVAAVEQWLQQLSDRIGPDTPDYLETEAAWRAYNKARNLRADRLRLQIPKWFWVWCTPDASGKIKCPPEILLEPSMLQYSFDTLTWAPSTAAWTVEVVDLDARQPCRNCWVGLPAEHPFNTTFAPCNSSVPLFIPEGSTREEVGAAIVVNPALSQPHVTALWVQEFSDAQAQGIADAPAAADAPSDASSARTPIPAADQANVQADLGATAPAQARLGVLADLASTAEI
ncbi:unnamed protein product [Phytophthora fragariaefolia]|uniref:Unnamed protein product n=1 Tax=Phytophthora fragariaefolia TaxID=1490495 RepID=A0A9W6TLZ1_9STRA|nr:unnamed protein product [Phytophthora fragariaefolia]